MIPINKITAFGLGTKTPKYKSDYYNNKTKSKIYLGRIKHRINTGVKLDKNEISDFIQHSIQYYK